MKETLNQYSNFWVDKKTAYNYAKKFDSRVDYLRHLYELNILKKYVKGNLYDCSLGSGRFIKELEKQTNSYSGMDYSTGFIEYINQNYPQIETRRGNLEDKIDEPDEKYDTVICMRTLFALNNLNGIIKEIKRITKKDGTIIFDYGFKRAFDVSLKRETSAEDIIKIIKNSELEIVKSYPLDSLLRLLKIKSKLKKIFLSHKLFSNKLFLDIEKLALGIYKHRILYILKRK